MVGARGRPPVICGGQSARVRVCEKKGREENERIRTCK